MMKMKLPHNVLKSIFAASILCSTPFSYANNAGEMKSAFDEAMSLGKAQNGQAQGKITSFDPQSISENFTSSPNEVNLKGNASNLGSIGTSELTRSNVGQAITDSTVNNPKITISEDADFLKQSDEIRQNAGVISGVKGGNQCVKQVLNKTSFTHHLCEKDNQINAICKRTQEVVWSGDKKIHYKSIYFSNHINMTLNVYRNKYDDGSRVHGHVMLASADEYTITFPENGIITGYDVQISKEGYYWGWNKDAGYGFRFLGEAFLRDKYPFRYWKESWKNYTFERRDLNFKVDKNQKLTLVLSGRWFLNRVSPDVSLRIYFKSEINTLQANLVEQFSCNAPFELENAVKIGEQCTQAGEHRNFVKDGQNASFYSDCWEKTETYSVSDASDNECKIYENNPNCTVASRECVLDLNGNCARFRNNYQCSVTTKTEGYLCGNEFFCSDGKCSDLEGSTNTDFGHAVSQLSNLAKANEDYDYDNQKFTAFSGRALSCRKSGFGFSDCCKDSGWGHKAGLAKCNSEEQMLGEAKEKKTAIFVGTYCDKKVLGKCIRRKSSYCVFDSKLARITQAQGRSGQLGIGFGGAKNPDCRGLTVDELQRIDFKRMDYTDFYEELNTNTNVPDKEHLTDYIKRSITEQMQRSQK